MALVECFCQQPLLLPHVRIHMRSIRAIALASTCIYKCQHRPENASRLPHSFTEWPFNLGAATLSCTIIRGCSISRGSESPPLDRKKDSCCGTFQGRNNALCNSQSNSVGVDHRTQMQSSVRDETRRRFFKPPLKM
jgi:hypothetical protein